MVTSQRKYHGNSRACAAARVSSMLTPGLIGRIDNDKPSPVKYNHSQVLLEN